jgi:hypothetical protein
VATANGTSWSTQASGTSNQMFSVEATAKSFARAASDPPFNAP